MKPKELFERVNTNLLVVDVQPGYSHHCNRIAGKICNLLNTHTGNKVVMFNNEELTGDTFEDIYQYYIDHGLNPELIEDKEIKFIEKEYAFLRGWMDNGVDDSIIIKTVRAMVVQRKYDSRDLDLEVILTPNEYEIVENMADSIFFPDWANLAFLKKLSPFYMCGGGRNECLREIELICNSFNIRYKLINELVY
jgi:hypothetical protein